jgi:hypothetical protein
LHAAVPDVAVEHPFAVHLGPDLDVLAAVDERAVFAPCSVTAGLVAEVTNDIHLEILELDADSCGKHLLDRGTDGVAPEDCRRVGRQQNRILGIKGGHRIDVLGAKGLHPLGGARFDGALVRRMLIGDLGLEAHQRTLRNVDLGTRGVDLAGGRDRGGVERHQLVTDLDGGGLDFESVAAAVRPVAGWDDLEKHLAAGGGDDGVTRHEVLLEDSRHNLTGALAGRVDSGGKSYVERCRRLDQGRILCRRSGRRIRYPRFGLDLLGRCGLLGVPRCEVRIRVHCRVTAVAERPPTADHGVVAVVLAHAVEIVEVGNDVQAGFLAACDDHAPTRKSEVVEAARFIRVYLGGCDQNHRDGGNEKQCPQVRCSVHFNLSPRPSTVGAASI